MVKWIFKPSVNGTDLPVWADEAEDDVIAANYEAIADHVIDAAEVTAIADASSNALQVRSFDGNRKANGCAALTPETTSTGTTANETGLTRHSSEGSEPVAEPASPDVTVIGAGATVELTSAYLGTISFAGATGTLIIDRASKFSGTISGQSAIGDVIDLADITGGADATIAYSGANSPAR